VEIPINNNQVSRPPFTPHLFFSKLKTDNTKLKNCEDLHESDPYSN
jgi:hypothetical protein